MAKIVKAKVRVKVFTDFGYWCLAEIRGLKEGTILEGCYNPQNKAFDFTYNGQDAMLWVNQNAELIGNEKKSMSNIIVTIAVCRDKDIIAEFDTKKEAKRYVKDEGYNNVEYWYLASEVINQNGDVNPACWGRTRQEAIEKLKKSMI